MDEMLCDYKSRAVVQHFHVVMLIMLRVVRARNFHSMTIYRLPKRAYPSTLRITGFQTKAVE